MTIADMTLDKLMEAPVTDELIREVSKRVWETQGNCAHRGKSHEIRGMFVDSIVCDECNDIIDARRVPAITRPENFWPLKTAYVIELDIFEWMGSDIACYRAHPAGDDSDPVYHGEPGLAVAFAFLKIKENEAINALDLPDAEDVLKMRGKLENKQ